MVALLCRPRHNGSEGGRHGIREDGIVVGSRQGSRRGVDDGGGEGGDDGASEDVEKVGVTL
jgi:hypothetical protein